MKCVGPTVSAEDIARIAEEMRFTPALDDLAQLLAIAASETRLKILYLLSEYRELCVCDLSEILGISSSATSQHLSRSKAVGLLKARRDQQTMYYSLTDHPFNESIKSIVAKALAEAAGEP